MPSASLEANVPVAFENVSAAAVSVYVGPVMALSRGRSFVAAIEMTSARCAVKAPSPAVTVKVSVALLARALTAVAFGVYSQAPVVPLTTRVPYEPTLVLSPSAGVTPSMP